MTMHDFKMGVIWAVGFFLICAIPLPSFAGETFDQEKAKVETMLPAQAAAWGDIKKSGLSTCGRVKVGGDWHQFILSSQINNDWAIAQVHKESRFAPRALMALCNRG
jgi:hypothetical protein